MFSNTPIVSTYSTKQVPVAYGLQLRPSNLSLSTTSQSDISQDAGMINMLPFKDPNNKEGLVAVTRNPVVGSTVGGPNIGNICRGMYVWEKTAGTVYYFVVVGTSVYTSINGVTWAAVTTLLTNVTTPVRFTEFIDATNVKKLVLVDGVEGYVFTTNAAGTKIVDADFPTPHIPFPVFLDGYLFLAKSGTGDIYNSDLNDPAAWTAGSFISSELYPDDVTALVKINNYLLALGSHGCEYFYDAANATASPLARYEGASLPIGCQIPNSIASNENTLCFIANKGDGQSVLVYIEDFKYKELDGSNIVIPYLDARFRNSSGYITYSSVRGFFMRQSGELLYVLRFNGSSWDNLVSTSRYNPTFVYVFSTNLWTEFRSGATGLSVYPASCSALTTTGNLVTYAAGTYNTASSVPNVFFGTVAESRSGVTNSATDDPGSGSFVIYQELRTPNLTFGTLNLKTMSRLGIFPENAASTSGTFAINVSWSNDDYSTMTTARTITYTMSGILTQYPFITQLGVFRKRAFKFTCTGGTFLRVSMFEVDINKGQQ